MTFGQQNPQKKLTSSSTTRSTTIGVGTVVADHGLHRRLGRHQLDDGAIERAAKVGVARDYTLDAVRMVLPMYFSLSGAR